MMKMRNAAGAAAMILSLGLAGCQTFGGPPPMAPQQTGVDGEWIAPNGIVSSLHGGAFQSKLAATGEVVTTGTYSYRDQNTIDLSFYSVKSQQRTTAACLLVTPDEMNCTLQSGTQFVLHRRTA